MFVQHLPELVRNVQPISSLKKNSFLRDLKFMGSNMQTELKQPKFCNEEKARQVTGIGRP
jgi:hypothetical protein